MFSTEIKYSDMYARNAFYTGWGLCETLQVMDKEEESIQAQEEKIIEKEYASAQKDTAKWMSAGGAATVGWTSFIVCSFINPAIPLVVLVTFTGIALGGLAGYGLNGACDPCNRSVAMDEGSINSMRAGRLTQKIDFLAKKILEKPQEANQLLTARGFFMDILNKRNGKIRGSGNVLILNR